MMTIVNAAAEHWWDWMAAMLWQSSLLIAIVAVVDRLVRRWAWPQVRYALWMLVLLKLLIPPGWSLPTTLVSGLEPRLAPISSQLLSRDLPAAVVAREAGRTATSAARPGPEFAAIAAEDADTSVRLSRRTLAMGVWAAGALGFAGLLVLKMLKLRRWHEEHRRRGAIPDWFHERLVRTASLLGLERIPAVVFSPDAVSPAVYGVVRPVLLLPFNYFDHLSETEAEHVLLHELAHLKRRDLWMQALALAMHVVYWFNPLMILVQHQSRHVREICCDLTVAAILKEKTMEYQKTLLNTARELLTQRVEVGLGLLGVFEEPFRLITRLHWLEKQRRPRGTSVMAASVGACLLFALFIMPMSRAASDAMPFAGATPAGSADALPYAGSAPGGLQLVTSERLHAAVLPVQGDPKDILEASKARLDTLMGAAGVQATGPVFGRFYFTDSENAPEGGPFWEIGYPVAAGTTVPPPLEIIRCAPLQMAVTRVEGTLDTTPAWIEFVGRITEAGYFPFPPSVQVWTGGEVFWQDTEMRVPVMRSDADYPGVEVSYANRESFTALTLSVHGPHSQFGQAVAQLDAYVRDNGIDVTGDLFGLYWSDVTTTPPEELEWAIGYPVGRGTRASAPFHVQEFEAGRVASATFDAGRNEGYPWAPVVIRTVLDGSTPVGPARVTWRTQSGRETTELEIPVLDVASLPGGEAGSPSGSGGAK